MKRVYPIKIELLILTFCLFPVWWHKPNLGLHCGANRRQTVSIFYDGNGPKRAEYLEKTLEQSINNNASHGSKLQN